MEDLKKQEQAAPASEETSGEMEYIDTEVNHIEGLRGKYDDCT